MTMHKPQQEKPVKKPAGNRRRFPWLFCIVLLITILIIKGAVSVLGKKANAREMNRAYRTELVELDKKETAMQSELSELQTPAGVEREIREKFRVTKAGEELVVVVPPKQDENSDADTAKGLFHFLKNIFKKNEAK